MKGVCVWWVQIKGEGRLQMEQNCEGQLFVVTDE